VITNPWEEKMGGKGETGGVREGNHNVAKDRGKHLGSGN